MHDEHKPNINKILICINLTDASRRAFYTGLDLAAKYGAETWILHVSEPIRAYDMAKKRYVETKEKIEKIEQGVKSRIDELWEEGGVKAVDRRKIQIEVTGGRASEEIVATAVAKEVDLIVLGSGHGGIVNRVARNAPCSVYVQRSRRRTQD